MFVGSGFFEILLVGLVGFFYVAVPLVALALVVYFFFQRRKEKKVEDKQDYHQY